MPPHPPRFAAIFRQPGPQEVELFRRRAELAAARAALAQREATLARLRAQLNSFEGRYIRQVGVLYIQLDEWEQRILELNAPPIVAGLEPEPDTVDKLAAAAPESETPTQTFLDLKALFREVAKRIHPDFALDGDDERRRTRLMAHANDAYNRSDAPLLQRMLHGYDPSICTGNTTDIATEIARVVALVDQCAQDVAGIDLDLRALAQSEMADLQQRTARAAADGRDLLAELAARVKGSIGIAMRRYELDLGRKRRKEAAFNPDPLLTAEIIQPR